MFKKLISPVIWSCAVIFAVATVSPLSAATYNVTDIENLTQNGFRTSVFHAATSNGGKSGATLATAIGGTATGTWDSVTGAFSVTFDVTRASDNATVGVTGTGTLNLGSTRANGIDGLVNFVFGQSIGGATNYAVQFLDHDYGIGPSPQPNSFDGSIPAIALWGADGTPTGSGGNFNVPARIGADLRIKLAPIPVPASFVLLGSALIGFGALRRKEKRRS